MEKEQENQNIEAREKGELCVRHEIVYVFKIFLSTHFDVTSTENGILPENLNPEPDDSENFEDEEDLLKAELKKIHDLEDKPLNDETEYTSDVDEL
jgi:hypothetical protein